MTFCTRIELSLPIHMAWISVVEISLGQSIPRATRTTVPDCVPEVMNVFAKPVVRGLTHGTVS